MTSCEEAIVNDMCGEDICFEYEYLSSAGEKDSSSGSSPEPELQDDKHHTANIEVMSEHSLVIKSLLACGGHVSEWFASGLALMPEPVEAVCCGTSSLSSRCSFRSSNTTSVYRLKVDFIPFAR